MTRAALTVPIRVALQAAGFADRELRVYTSQRSWLTTSGISAFLPGR